MKGETEKYQQRGHPRGRWWREPRFWMWAALLSSVALCAAVPVAYWRIQTSLQEMVQAGQHLRTARVHLNKGFLHVMMAGDPESPYSREQGLALLKQAGAEFEQTASQAGLLDKALIKTESFLKANDEFGHELERWSRSMKRDARLEVELRAAFYKLEAETDRVDLLMQQQLRILTERYDDGFRLSLLIAGLTFLVICNIIYFAEKARDRGAGALRQANRSLRMLTDCNQAMVRCNTEEEMLNEVCRIIVQEGGHLSAWVGIPMMDEGKSVRIAAQVGSAPGQLEQMKLTWADVPFGQGPTGVALRTGSVNVVEDLSIAPQFRVWREQAVAFGRVSACALPIKFGEQTVAAITIVAAKMGAFPQPETDLLKELADDLARGLSGLRNREARAAAEAKLRVFRSLIDHTLDAIFVRDAISGAMIDVNEAACRERGYTREELLMLQPEEIDAGLFGGTDWIIQMGQIRDNGSLVFNSRHRRKDGTAFPVEISATYLKHQEQEYVIGIVRDVTERRRVEEENERLAAIVQSSDDAIVGKDLEGMVTSWNKGAERLFGYAAEEMVGQSIQKLCPPDRLHEEEDIQAHFLKGESVDHSETVRVHKDGRLINVSVTVSPVRNKDGEIIGASKVARDITAIKAAAMEKERLEQQLNQSQKMEAIGQLSGGIAHDFNNLLGAIMGNAEVAKLDLDEKHPAWECLVEIGKASMRAKQLVQQILAFSRRQKIERKQVVLRPLIEESLKLMRATMPSNVEISLSGPATPLAVLADATQIQQVILNLVTNAWHAMEGKAGKVDIRVEKKSIDEETAKQMPELRPGLYVCIYIKDNGKGMDAAILERIFDPFFTTKAPGQGTGLGLSVVHGIVKAHNGAVRVTSQPGEGTEFELYLPVPERTTAEEVQEKRAQPRGRGQHLFYLDDEQALTWLARRSFERMGYRVTTFNDADLALQAFRQAPETFDAVITDYNMPVMSGLQFAKSIRTIRPGVPVLLCSGYITDELKAEAEDVGIKKLLYKPSTVEAMVAAVEELLNQ